MTGRLYVAAGGGGDAIAAAMLHSARRVGGRAAIATYAWDRLIIDPLPGPRDASWFDGLDLVGRHNFRIGPTASVRAPAGSTLPRLARELPADLYLLDPSDGAVGLHRQLRELVDVLEAEAVWVVDVGGDMVARGDEPTLRSPLADSLAAAAAAGLAVPTKAVIAGPGLDGELSEETVLARLVASGSSLRPSFRLGAEAASFESLFYWHPTEATGLLAAAALGERGVVEMRDSGLRATLTDDTAAAWVLPMRGLLQTNSIAQRLVGSASLAEADTVVTDYGRASELALERQKAHRQREATEPAAAIRVGDVLDALRQAHSRGVDFVTVRRLAEMLGCRTLDITRLRKMAQACGVQDSRPPLISVKELGPG